MFLFSDLLTARTYGYDYDGLRSDGFYYYTGAGQVGDQSPQSPGNKALLDARENGRTIRLFESRSPNTTYVGEVVLSDPPYTVRKAPDRDRNIRDVLVFKLLLVSGVAETLTQIRGDDDPLSAVEIPVESSVVDTYLSNVAERYSFARRDEARLVLDYADWLRSRGHSAVRHRVSIPNGPTLYTDLFDKESAEVIEAKSASSRPAVRLGLGQVLDYSRYVDHDSAALLVPDRPADDLVDLLVGHGVSPIWRSDRGFDRAN